jgi:predicted esterase
MPRRNLLVVLGLWVLPSAAAVEPPEAGFRPEVRVARTTRLDSKFVAPGLPDDYDPAEQRYQLFLPPGYQGKKPWPLVVLVPPGDASLGWSGWEKLCAERGLFFCAPYGAGSRRPLAVRVRVVLDMLDDVRRRYLIDPERTYLVGFSAGGELASRLAFSLPEYFGGLALLGSKPAWPKLAYLRHLARDRLSVALAVGAEDPRRRETEAYSFPLLKGREVRTRLWVVPAVGHALPPAEVLAGMLDWLEEDLPRRRRHARAWPELTATPRKVLTDRERAEQVLEAARRELSRPDRLYRGSALLEGIVARWGRTEAAEKAGQLLAEIREDPERSARLRAQRGEELRRLWTAEARALEGAGRLGRALAVWRRLARAEADTAAGQRAATRAEELEKLLARTAYLGLRLAGETATVAAVEAGGPAARAGLRKGDRITRFGGVQVATAADLARALKTHAPGDKVKVDLLRGGARRTVEVTLAAVPEK